MLLLPDSLIVAPILLAVYFLLRGRRQPRVLNFLFAGALVGLSCWFRANALLLAPFFAALTPLFVRRGKRTSAATAILAGALLVIALIAIKNAIVFHRFVPLSLGAGQTLLEGIAEYDEANRFNIPKTDLGIMRQEAEWYGKPEYAQLLFGTDGVERERMRLARGFAVIGSHPFWFAGVVMRRGIASTRLNPVPVLAPESPVTRELVSKTVGNIATDDWLRLQGDSTNYGTLHVSEVMSVKHSTDYALDLPVKLEQGRVQVKITDEGKERVLASTGVDLKEGVSADAQPVHHLTIPFVSANNSQVRVVIVNFASESPRMLVGTSKLIDLGPSSYEWLRYARLPIGFAQRLFKTAWLLPLLVIGMILLIRERDWPSLVILLAVPAYYLLVQSILHTERRYV